ncbi:MAG: hypothetical protein WB682_02830 [Candidatus Dormiibacterota bacterium]
MRLRPARESSQLNCKYSVPKRAFRRHVMCEVGGERNRGEQLGQAKPALGFAFVRYPAASRPVDDPSIMRAPPDALARRF